MQVVCLEGDVLVLMGQVIDFNTAPIQGEALKPDRTERIKSALEARAKSFVSWMFPAAFIRRGEARVGSLKGEPGESLWIGLVNAECGRWRDHATDEQGGDFISLFAAANSLDQRHDFSVILDELEEWLGWRQSAFQARPQQAARESYRDAPKPADEPLGAPTSRWHYLDTDSNIIATVSRYDLPNGSKTYRPWDAKASRHQMPEPRPLYNMPALQRADTVVLVEGEKCADALISAGYAATTVMGGANAPMDKTDWSPIRGKQIILWPDNDEAGRRYAAELPPFLRAFGCGVRVVEIPDDMPEKWDAADAADEGRDLGAILNVCTSENDVYDLLWFGNCEPRLDTADFVEDLLCDGQMSVVYGESNCGKTFFIFDVAASVAQGRMWRGRAVERGAVIYVALEGVHGIRNRIAAYAKHYGLVGDDKIPLAAITSAVNMLNEEADVQRLINSIRAAGERMSLPVRMIVIDTLSRALAGGNENGSDDMGALVKNADRVRQATGAHLCFVHHSGKDQAKGARGHSLLRAATDTEIEVSREFGLSIGTVKVTKQRELEGGDEFAFRLEQVELGVNGRGKKVSSCVVVPEQNDPVKRLKLSGQIKLAFDLLQQAVEYDGEEPPANIYKIRTNRVVRTDVWLGYWERSKICVSDKPDTHRRAFQRCVQKLQEIGIVEIWERWVWVSDKPDTAGQGRTN